MISYLPLRSLFQRMREVWKPWLAAAVLTGVVILIAAAAALRDYSSVLTVVNFSYAGIEYGLNPMGSRFDPDEIKNAEVLASAGAAIGLELDEEQTARIQDAITITGNIPRGTVARVTEYVSAYAEDKLNNTDEVKSNTYYPTQYEISLRYREAGLTSSQGMELLNAILTCYQNYFSSAYGYNAAFEQAIRELDYSAYDYEDAVDVLGNNLLSLSQYLTWLDGQNNTRYVSSTTGLSFRDLASAIDTLRTQNVYQIRLHIQSNRLTKDKDDTLAFYRHKISALKRSLGENESQLAVLNERIANYVKDSALIMNSGGNGETNGYTVSQPSEMYNAMIQQSVEVQTSISSIQESILYYQDQIEQIELMSANESSQDLARKLSFLEGQFTLLDEEINKILDKTRETAKEYFETVSLDKAFLIAKAPFRASALVRAVKRALRPGVGAEAVLFGAFVLSSGVYVLWKRRKVCGVPAESVPMDAVPAKSKKCRMRPVSAGEN